MANHSRCSINIIVNPFSCSLIFINLAAWLSLASINVLATQYTVGDSSGWNLGTDYGTWASQHTFKTGDTLKFTYSGQHSVVQVSETDYKSCSTANAISSDSSGSTVEKLDKAQTYYFICGTGGHCQEGMQLSVAVSAGGASSSTPSTIDTPASSTTPSSSSLSTLADLSLVFTLLLACGAAMVISYTSSGLSM